MAENKVSVEITLEEKAALKALTQLSKEIQKTETGFTKMGDEGEKSLGVIGQATSGVSSGFKTLVSGVTIANLASSAIIGTANAIKGFVVDSVNAAIEAEQATNRLGQSLRATGGYSEEAVADFLNYATALSQVTKYSDDAITEQLGLAKSFGASNKQAKDLVSAAAELAATFGGSLESRVQQLGKTLQGTGGKLDTLIPGFKALTETQLKAGDALDFINKKFGGAASNEINTYAGKLELTKKAFGELQESIGGYVVDSGLVKFFTMATDSLNKFTQSINDNKIAQQRDKDGFVETEDSMNQLSREYEALTIRVEELTKKGTLLPGGLDSFDTAKIKQYRKELENLETQVKNASIEVKVTGQKAPPVDTGGSGKGGISPEDQKLINSRKEAYAQLEIARASFNQVQIEQDVVNTQITEENYAFELQRLNDAEAMKIEAIYAAEELKANAIADGKTKQYTLLKIAQDKEAALDKSKLDSKKKVDTAELALADQKRAALIGITGGTFTLLAALAKDGSKEQFYIQKAAAVAEIAIAHGKAIALIPAQTSTIPYPANLAAIAQMTGYVQIQTALGLATVAASAIKGFEQGGVVGGTSYSGDKNIIRVNSGETILNRQQQANTLMAVANGGASGSGVIEALNRMTAAIMAQPINVVVDSRAIATVVRKEVQSGFKIA